MWCKKKYSQKASEIIVFHVFLIARRTRSDIFHVQCDYIYNINTSRIIIEFEFDMTFLNSQRTIWLDRFFYPPPPVFDVSIPLTMYGNTETISRPLKARGSRRISNCRWFHRSEIGSGLSVFSDSSGFSIIYRVLYPRPPPGSAFLVFPLGYVRHSPRSIKTHQHHHRRCSVGLFFFSLSHCY